MKSIEFKKAALAVALLLSVVCAAPAQTTRNANSPVAERNVRAHMEFLAGDAMQGRGSGTQFELVAVQYAAAQMRQFGLEAAGEAGAAGEKTYVQTVSITRSAFAENPKMTFSVGGGAQTLEHGGEMVVLRMSQGEVRGELHKIYSDEKPKSGAIAFVRLRAGEDQQSLTRNLQTIMAGGARAVVVEETAQWRAQWATLAGRKPSFTTVANVAGNQSNIIVVSRKAAAGLAQAADGSAIQIKGALAEPQRQQTWNAVGKITGTDPKLSSEVVLLSAHIDHLGVRANAPGEDKIFNGADDDASGCTAVLELARTLAAGKKPKRTVYFAFFGSEEAGGYGSQYFVNTLPFPKENLVANLQFEMLGRPDPKVAADTLWLTGYERSNLGAELAKKGARLVADPHPDQNFFQRSDNYALARQGIVAHTVSSFGLHTDYHRASDELKTIDFGYMTRAIGSMVKPVEWLVNSNFKPAWVEGKKP